MSEFFTDGQRDVQERVDSRRLADRMADAVIRDTISDSDREFIEARDMLFLATVDAEGRANCSYKGGEPGFVRVVNAHTVAFPIYDGNGMYMTTGSIADQGEVGLLFVDFEGQSRLRLNGVATLHFDDELMSDYPEAQFIVRVRAREVFINCPRYIHKMELVERSQYVPKAEVETPIADWKQNMVERGAGDLLRADDPARKQD